jgi:hypothetical protein
MEIDIAVSVIEIAPIGVRPNAASSLARIGLSLVVIIIVTMLKIRFEILIKSFWENLMSRFQTSDALPEPTKSDSSKTAKFLKRFSFPNLTSPYWALS